MRLFCLLFLYCLALNIQAQIYFPVKIEDKWSLVSDEGHFWEKDSIDALHLYDSFGYFIFQRKEKIGLISREGDILIPANKSDIRPINSSFVEYSDGKSWIIGGTNGRLIYDEVYEAVIAIDSSKLKLKVDGKWGCLDNNGTFIVAPEFDNIDWDKSGFFIVQRDAKLGVINTDGDRVLTAKYDEIIFLVGRGFAFRKGNDWGFCNIKGNLRTETKYYDFKKFTDGFLKLQSTDNKGFSLLSLESFKVSAVDNILKAYPYSNGAVVFSSKIGKIGLLDKSGKVILPAIYQEIVSFSEHYFRVKKNNRWAVVGRNNKTLFPFEFNYISALNKNTCILIKGDKCAIGTVSGKIISDFEYDEINWGQNEQIHCFKGESLSIFYEEDGLLVGEQSFNNFLTIQVGEETENKVLSNAYQLKDYEWVFVAEQSKWGLRNKKNDSFKISPQFDEINVFDDLGFTLTSIRRPAEFDISKVDFQFLNVFGIVNNKTGHCSDMELVHIYFEDFDEGLDVARCIFKDLSFGLISRKGYFNVKRFEYLGPFKDGLAAAASLGELSADFKNNKDTGLGKVDDFLDVCLASSRMIDYTEYANNFKKEATLYCKECNWGFIDLKGKWTIPAIYDYAKTACNGRGIVKQQGKWGLVKEKGKIVLDFSYDAINFIQIDSSAMLRVEKYDPRYGIIDHMANELIPFDYEELGEISGERIAVKKNGLWGFIDRNGAIKIGCAFNEVRAFSQGLAAVRKGNKWGFINEDGDLVLDFKFNRCGQFKEGLCWVYSNSRAYYINKNGHQAFSAVFASATDFEEGIARVKVSGKYGLIDRTGNFILKPRYLKISSFNRYGLAIVEFVGTSNARFALVDREGSSAGLLKFNEIRPFKEGFAAVKINKHWGFINTSGRLVVESKYFSVGDFSNGRAAVYKNGRCGYIDYQGEIVVDLLYNGCYEFEEDKAVVQLPRMRDGLIDKNGEVLIKPSIKTLFSFSEGRGLVRDKSMRYYFISENANMYDGFYQSAKKFQFGVAPVQRKDKWGLINLKGMWVCRPKYKQISRLDNGMLLARIDGYTGLTDLDGNFLAPMQYLQLDIAKENIFTLETSNGIDYLRSNGEWIWKSD
jgi:hypothetical protein